MTQYTNQQWILKKRPSGLLKAEDLHLKESVIPELKDGECLIKVMYLAMDPATRGWMSDEGGYLDPLPLDGPVMGVTIGEVVESKNPEIKPGLVVAGVGEWAKYIVVGPERISPVQTGVMGVLGPMDTSSGHDLPMYLHAMGTSGATAWHGLVNIGGVKEGDTVLVSGAHGSVGSMVCQIAKLKGAANVVGIAGGAEKCAELKSLYHCDAAIDYRAEPDISAAIARECPNGVNVYFDNVGGEILEGAIGNLAMKGRVAICGMISQYNASEPAPGPTNLWNLLAKTARMEGFLITGWLGSEDSQNAFNQISDWLKEGKMHARVDVRTEFDEIYNVFNLLFNGGNKGRLLVKVPE